MLHWALRMQKQRLDNDLTPISTDNCANDFDKYLIGPHLTKPNLQNNATFCKSTNDQNSIHGKSRY